jgi:hypothetical protein
MPMLEVLEGLTWRTRAIMCRARRKCPWAVEAINGSIQSLLRRGRGYKNLGYPPPKARLIAATRSEFVAFRAKRPKMLLPSDSRAKPLRQVGSCETAIISVLLRDRQNAGATARAQTSER